MHYKWQKTLAVFFIILGLGVIGLGVVFQNRVLRQSRESRSQADSTPKVNVNWSEVTNRVERGKSTALDLKINSQNYQFSGLEFWGSITGIPQSEVKFETLAIPGLVPISQELKTQDNKVLFHLVYFSDVQLTSLFTTNNAMTSVGRLVFTPIQNRTVEVKLDTSRSDVASYLTANLGLNFLDGGSRTFSLELFEPGQGDGKKECNLNCATDTECKSQYICFQGRCRDPQVKEDEKCGSKPDLGLQRQCNQYCADTRECAAGFTCWYNFCRNPRNLENTECKNPAPPQSRSNAGVGGNRPSPSPSPVIAQVTITSRPPQSTRSAAATSSSQVATRSSRVASPSPSVTASPSTAPKPSIVPIPVEEESDSSIWGSLGRVLLVILIIMAIGAGVWWWSQNRPPRAPTDY